jgi:hypothetical protein
MRQHRAEHHGDRSAQSENSVRSEFRFQREQRERKDEKRDAGPVDRQQPDSAERSEQRRNCAGDSRGDQARES